jgi:hypothetical protein
VAGQVLINADLTALEQRPPKARRDLGALRVAIGA